VVLLIQEVQAVQEVQEVQAVVDQDHLVVLHHLVEDNNYKPRSFKYLQRVILG
jgi:predicted metallo-beta-lactamase superfamily hydrolase